MNIQLAETLERCTMDPNPTETLSQNGYGLMICDMPDMQDMQDMTLAIGYE